MGLKYDSNQLKFIFIHTGSDLKFVYSITCHYFLTKKREKEHFLQLEISCFAPLTYIPVNHHMSHYIGSGTCGFQEYSSGS